MPSAPRIVQTMQLAVKWVRAAKSDGAWPDRRRSLTCTNLVSADRPGPDEQGRVGLDGFPASRAERYRSCPMCRYDGRDGYPSRIHRRALAPGALWHVQAG